MNTSFWAGKKVFVTGHTGFKGGWLSLWLASLGARVAGYALSPSTDPNLFDLAGVGQAVERSHIGDIRDAAGIAAAVSDFAPDILLHLAAQPLVRRSYADPVETYSTNVMGTVHVLEAVRRCASVRAVVVVTSDKCYENREWLWAYREDEPMGGFDPYSSSKGCAELLAGSWRRSYFATPDHPDRGPALATARAGNVIGGGDWSEDRLVPDILRAFAAGDPVLIRSPAALRPWQHVIEPLAGYLTLAEKLWNHGSEFAEGWNFGPDSRSEKPVSYIVDKLASLWGDKAGWRLADGWQPHEAHLLKLDSAKARARLGWQPRWTVDKALAATVSWQKGLLSGQAARELVLSQIADYQASGQEP